MQLYTTMGQILKMLHGVQDVASRLFVMLAWRVRLTLISYSIHTRLNCLENPRNS